MSCVIGCPSDNDLEILSRRLRVCGWAHLSYYLVVDRVSAAASYTDCFLNACTCFVIEARDDLTAAADTTNRACRMTDRQVKIRYRLCHQRSHPDHRKPADHQVVTDGAACAYCCALSYKRGQRVFIGVRRAQLLQVGGRGSWEAIVREDCARADHYTVLDCHRVADVNHCVDLHSVAYGHAVGNVALLANDTFLADS